MTAAGDIKFEELNAAALAACPGLLSGWFPKGTSKGRWFHVGNLAGNPGKSLFVNLSNGIWKDAATDQKGQDLTSLLAAKDGLGQADAARELAAKLGRPELAPEAPEAGVRGPHVMVERARQQGRVATEAAIRELEAAAVPEAPEAPEAEPAEIWEPSPAPEDFERRKALHYEFGMPHQAWIYHLADGAPVFGVLRWDDKPRRGAKVILPYAHGRRVWTDHKGTRQDRTGWHFKHGATPRPLFGLPRLAELPEARVLVVEGEATRDAAAAMLEEAHRGEWIVTTWAGGTANVAGTDWSSLAGRRVVVWPDADRKRTPAGKLRAAGVQPGMKAALAIATELVGLAAEVVVVNPPGPPYGTGADAWADALDGWDLADAATMNWDGQSITMWIALHPRDMRPAGEEAAEEAGGDDDGPSGEEIHRPAEAAEADRPPSYREIEAARWASIPITPLGTRHGDFWFLSALGEHRKASAYQLLKDATLLDLFAGEARWFRDHFPAYDKEGAPKPGSWSPAQVGTWLLRACARAGLYDAAQPVRGPGTWPNGTGGVIVHCGDALRQGADTAPDAWQPAGRKDKHGLYAAWPAITRPADMAAGPEVGAYLLETIKRWNFRDEVGPDAMLGWLGQAFLGGAHRWRGHCYTIAEIGSGKSWLADFVKAALGPTTQDENNDFTEAGLRQRFTGQARALILDEAEGGEDSARMDAVLHLIRKMSGGAGARVVRGSAGGTDQGFHLMGSAYLTSVLKGRLQPADRSRMIVLRLGPLASGDRAARADAETLARIARAAAQAPALWARCIEGWPRFRESFEVWREAMVALEWTPRQAEHFATFAAGRDLLLRDDVVDAVAAKDEAEVLWGPMRDDMAEAEEGGTGQSCLSHLYSSEVARYLVAGVGRVYSELILEAMDTKNVEACRELERRGLQVVGMSNPDTARLLVATNYERLRREVFAGTPWEHGWGDALGYLPGAERWPDSTAGHKWPRRFAGAKSRAIALPLEWMPAAGEVEEIEGETEADRASAER